jgi:hypothetical protein
VLFDGTPVGTIQANAQGSFAGSISIPPGTAPGTHTITVKGSVCVLEVSITVVPLAFSGASSHTTTYALVAVAAIVVGAVFVLGSRRRRQTRRRRSRGSP